MIQIINSFHRSNSLLLSLKKITHYYTSAIMDNKNKCAISSYDIYCNFFFLKTEKNDIDNDIIKKIYILIYNRIKIMYIYRNQ